MPQANIQKKEKKISSLKILVTNNSTQSIIYIHVYNVFIRTVDTHFVMLH